MGIKTDNKLGFSLAEIVVATGILGIVSLGTIQIMQTTNRQGRKIVVDTASKNIIDRIKHVFRNPESCTLTLSPFVATAGTVVIDNTPATCTAPPAAANPTGTTGIRNASGLLFKKCQRWREGLAEEEMKTVIIGDIVFKNYLAKADGETTGMKYETTFGTQLVGEIGKLVVEVELITSTYGKASMVKQSSRFHQIFVNVIIDSTSKQILSCYSENIYADAACSSIGGVIDATSGRCNSKELCFSGIDYDGGGGTQTRCYTSWPKVESSDGTWCYWVAVAGDPCADNELATGFDAVTGKARCCDMGIKQGSYKVKDD